MPDGRRSRRCARRAGATTRPAAPAGRDRSAPPAPGGAGRCAIANAHSSVEYGDVTATRHGADAHAETARHRDEGAQHHQREAERVDCANPARRLGGRQRCAGGRRRHLPPRIVHSARARPDASARSSTAMRLSISAQNASVPIGPLTRAPDISATRRQFADDRHVVRMTQPAVRAAGDGRVTRHDDHAKRPGRAERHDGPPLERLRRESEDRDGAPDRTNVSDRIERARLRGARARRLRRSSRETRRDRRRASRGRRRPAARCRRAPAARVRCAPRAAPRRASARTRSRAARRVSGVTDISGVLDRRAQARRREARAPRAAADGAGDATSDAQHAVEPPLPRELGAAGCAASRSCTPRQPCSSASSAAAAASSPPRTAKRRPSPVIGSMKPAASPASSSPSMRGVADVDGQRARARRACRPAARRRTGRAATGSRASSRAAAPLRIAQAPGRRAPTASRGRRSSDRPARGATPM